MPAARAGSGPCPPASGQRSSRSWTAGRNPHDKALIELVGELSTRSALFRTRWASQDVRFHRSGRKRVRHPAVGQLDLDFESLELASAPGLVLNVYTAPAGSPAMDALKLLASWAVSQEGLATETVAAAGATSGDPVDPDGSQRLTTAHAGRR